MCVMLAIMYRSPRAARAATFAYFAVNGFVMGTWVVHINVIARQAGVGTATLGYLLLALGGSAFVGMRLCGPLNDRLGPRRVIPVSAALFSAAVVLPALARNVSSLARPWSCPHSPATCRRWPGPSPHSASATAAWTSR